MEEKELFKTAIKNCKNNKELANIYNHIMGTTLSVDTIRKKCNLYGYHIKDNIDTGVLKSDESLKWLEENKNKYETTTDLHKAYNEHFKVNVKHASFVYNLKGIIQSKKKLEYNEEETQWFKENAHKYYSHEDMMKAFNETFNRDLTFNEFRRKFCYMKLHIGKRPKEEKEKISLEFKKKRLEKKKREKELLPKKPRKTTTIFNLEQLNWLRNNTNKYRWIKDLYVDFQKQFNSNLTELQVRDKVHRMGLILKKSMFSDEEIKWLIKNYNCKKSYTELSQEFYKKFGKKINKHTLKATSNKIGLRKDKENYASENGWSKTKLPIGTEKIFNNRNKRRSKEENQGRGITEEQWKEMMDFFNWTCAYSGEYIGGIINEKRTVDHIIPLSKEGENEPWNLVPMLKSYNNSKHTKDMLEWYLEQEFFSIERLTKIYEWRVYAYWKWKDEI